MAELASKGCRKVAGLGDVRLYECPESYFDEETMRIIGLVFMLEGSGRHFFEGGIAGQPCWLIEAMQIFNAERARCADEGKG
ncbi:MAG TPA: hypothetical protein VII64_02530 [Thermodesulfobacteriota bacterium]